MLKLKFFKINQMNNLPKGKKRIAIKKKTSKTINVTKVIKIFIIINCIKFQYQERGKKNQ